MPEARVGPAGGSVGPGGGQVGPAAATGSFETDDFSGSTGDPLLQDYKPLEWALVTGAMRVRTASSDVYPISSSAEHAYRRIGTWNANQYAQIVISEWTSGDDPLVGPAVRCSDSAATYYGLYTGVSYNLIYLFSMVAGTFTTIASASASGNGLGVGDVLRLEIDGTTLRPLLNGAQIVGMSATYTDSSIASGSVGLCGYSQAAQCRLDDWEGGNLTAGGVNVTPSPVAVNTTVVNPGVTLGSLSLSSIITLNLSVVSPTVVLGSVAVSPLSTINLLTIDPVVSIGGGSINVAPVASSWSVVSPTVTAGALTITPSAIACSLSTVNPAAIQGSVAVTPAPSVIGLLQIDPVVTIDGGGPTPSTGRRVKWPGHWRRFTWT